MYFLSADIIRSTLECVSQWAKGSKVIFDFKQVVSRPCPSLERVFSLDRLLGEPLHSLLTDDEVAILLEEHHLVADGPPIWAADAAGETRDPRYQGKVASMYPSPPIRMKLLSATLH